MTRLHLSLACWDYDRVKPLQDGRVHTEGIDLTFLPLRVEETFFRQLRNQEFDVAELSLSSYLLTLNIAEPPFVAIPVFPSRFFRHQSIYVNSERGIRRPEDLVGKRVGTPEYQMTAGVWQRGLLSEEYGVPFDRVRYFVGAIEDHGRTEKIPLQLPEHIDVTAIGPDTNLSTMLADGELDAIYSASQPSCYGRVPHVRHLFEDFKEVEKNYYRRTGIFPIMHTIVLKRELHERHPWVARSLTKAFEAARDVAYEDLVQRSALKTMLPWLHDHVRETVAALGEDYWPYGIEANRVTLEKFARYSYDQGLAKRVYAVEEMFVAEAAETFRI